MSSIKKILFKISNIIGYKSLSLFNFIFLALLFAIVMYVALSPSLNKFGLFKSPLVILAESGALVALLIYFVNVRIESKLLSKIKSVMIPLIFILFLIIQFITATALQSTGYTWDSQQLLDHASKYALYGKIDPYYINYVQIHPNNTTIFVYLSMLFKFLHNLNFNDFFTAAIYLNIFFLWITQIVLYKTSKRLFGQRVAIISLFFGFIFICLSMYNPIIYSDTLTIVFPISIFYLGLCLVKTAKVWEKIIYALLIGMIAAMGTMIKPTVLIAFIALAIISFLWLFDTNKEEKNIKKIVIVSLSCLLASVFAIWSTYIINSKIIDSMNILSYSNPASEIKSISPIFYAAMGLKTSYYSNTINYGGYDEYLTNKVISLPTEKERIDFSLQKIKSQLKSYGPLGYLNFIAHKSNWILSDGTFYAFGEGSNKRVVFANNDLISKFIRDFMYVDGSNYIMFGNILQVFWIAILILISAQLLVIIKYPPARYNLYPTTSRIMIAGILIFLIIFEGRSRYIFLYIPIFIIAAMHTLRWLQDS